MKFKMNNRNWEILETDQKKLKEIEECENEKGNIYGLCCYDTQIIYLWEDLHKEQKRETLIHELLHCYIGCYCSFEDVVWNEDLMCNVCANSHDIIHDIVNKYFDNKTICVSNVLVHD